MEIAIISSDIQEVSVTFVRVICRLHVVDLQASQACRPSIVDYFTFEAAV